MPFLTGRTKATRSLVFKSLETYATKPIPTPPPTFEVPGQAEIHEGVEVYPLDGNDIVGDCTIAGMDHFFRAQAKLYNCKYSDPSTSALKSKYFHLTGGQDSGLNEEFVLNTFHKESFFGSKVEAFAPVSTTSLLQWHQSIAFYGGLYLGIRCPESARRAFQKELETKTVVPWTYEGEETEDGHCVVALGYGPNGGLHCATWGGIAVLTPSFLAHYLDEAWVILSSELVEAKGDTLGLNIEALKEDISHI